MGESIVTTVCRGGRTYASLNIGDGLFIPVDQGCDLVRFDPRFGRCLTCPLVAGCRFDLPPHEQRRLEAQLRAGAGFTVQAVRSGGAHPTGRVAIVTHAP